MIDHMFTTLLEGLMEGYKMREEYIDEIREARRYTEIKRLVLEMQTL